MADEYETTVFKHDFQRDDILKALDIVRKFIITNKRILVGGMGMDLSLKSVGSQLYKTDKLPDYDFYSPIFHSDAYAIGEQLVDADLNGISVIRGTHVSTMRVRVNYVSVADITYIPENVYDEIPTIEYENMTLCHPHYQMIDQHISLSMPFNNPPMETILNRWKKDIERYDILYSGFPINITSVQLKKLSKLTDITISTDLLTQQCLSGYISLLYWINHAKDNGYKESKEITKMSTHIGSLNITKNKIQCKLPNNITFNILSDNFITLCKEIQKVEKIKDVPKYYNALLDKIPRHIKINEHISVFDNKGRLIAAHYDEKIGIYISSLQESMSYLLTLGIINKNVNALVAYKYSQDILYWASAQYSETKKDNYLLYLPIVSTFGAYNWSESYIVAREDVLTQFKYIAKEIGAPKNAYPDKGNPIDKRLYNYDPTESKLYQIDGLEVNELYERNLPI